MNLEPLNLENNTLLAEYNKDIVIKEKTIQVKIRCYEEPVLEAGDISLHTVAESFYCGSMTSEKLYPGFFNDKDASDFFDLVESHPEIFVPSLKKPKKLNR